MKWIKKLTRIGGSLAVVIPPDLLKTNGIDEDSELEITDELDGTIQIKKVTNEDTKTA